MATIWFYKKKKKKKRYKRSTTRSPSKKRKEKSTIFLTLQIPLQWSKTKIFPLKGDTVIQKERNNKLTPNLSKYSFFTKKIQSCSSSQSTNRTARTTLFKMCSSFQKRKALLNQHSPSEILYIPLHMKNHWRHNKSVFSFELYQWY